MESQNFSEAMSTVHLETEQKTGHNTNVNKTCIRFGEDTS